MFRLKKMTSHIWGQRGWEQNGYGLCHFSILKSQKKTFYHFPSLNSRHWLPINTTPTAFGEQSDEWTESRKNELDWERRGRRG